MSADADTTTTEASGRRTIERELTNGGEGFLIDGVTGTVPDGYEDGHVRAFYIYLGQNAGDGDIAWLSIAIPRVTRIGPWPPDTKPVDAPADVPAEPAPEDIREALDERGLPVQEWGELSFDGITTPVVSVEGYLDICASPPAGLPPSRAENCRYNDGHQQFYVFIPYNHGTLVVEGEVKDEAKRGDIPTAEEMAPVVDELQSWADSIDLP